MAMRQASILVSDPAARGITGIPLENYLGIYSVRNDVNESVLQVDGTAYVQQRINDARASAGANTSGGIVLLPPGIIRVSTLTIYEGIYLLGCGTRATELRQMAGVNASMITQDPAVNGVTSFLHHAGVSHMYLRKEGTSDTVGCAIELNCRMGEHLLLTDLHLGGWPESGIRLLRGGQPVRLTNIHAFGSREYAIDLRRTGSDIWHMVSLDMISGDNHGKGLIHLDTAGAPMETFSITNVKAEKASAAHAGVTTMPCVIECDRLNGAALHLENIAFHAIQPAHAVIRVSSSTVRIKGGIVRAGNTPLLIDDIPTGRQVPYSASRLGWEYTSQDGLTP